MMCDICDHHQSGVLYTSDSNLFHRTLSSVTFTPLVKTQGVHLCLV
nr:MAG TPA: hypothetical protein [Bacteriophage sp.]